MSFKKVLGSLFIAVLLMSFSAVAQQEKPKEGAAKEMKGKKEMIKKEGKHHRWMKAKAMKEEHAEKKTEKKEAAPPK